jgi:spore maturation protein CgeB
MNIVMLGLSITSSWGNGHATTYRALARGLASRGHDVLFLERDVRWYAKNRDLPDPPYCRLRLYQSLDDLRRTHTPAIEEADLVIVGSYVPDGADVAELVLRAAGGCAAFYDIDTPVTLGALEAHGTAHYLERSQVPRFDLYLSFTGGPTLERLERDFGAQRARALYCSADIDNYYAEDAPKGHDLGYLGTYSLDRQATLDELLIAPAHAWPCGRFVIAGAQYPPSVITPANVTRIMHVSPAEHRSFYNGLRFTLNVTRRDMIEAGHSPSVRLFEAAACGTPIVSDDWPGLSSILTPGQEVLIARHSRDVLACLRDIPEEQRVEVGRRAQRRILAAHTSRHRAIELERYTAEVLRRPTAPRVAALDEPAAELA